MNLTDAVRNPQFYVRKAGGRLRRRAVQIPDQAVVEEMMGGVRFEHKRLSFLEEDDIRAMMTRFYDITLCDCFRKHLSPGGIVPDVGANIGYLSVVAACCAGEVHGFEPLAECFEGVQNLSRLYSKFNFFFHNSAIGAPKGTLSIGFNPEGDKSACAGQIESPNPFCYGTYEMVRETKSSTWQQ